MKIGLWDPKNGRILAIFQPKNCKKITFSFEFSKSARWVCRYSPNTAVKHAKLTIRNFFTTSGGFYCLAFSPKFAILTIIQPYFGQNVFFNIFLIRKVVRECDRDIEKPDYIEVKRLDEFTIRSFYFYVTCFSYLTNAFAIDLPN